MPRRVCPRRWLGRWVLIAVAAASALAAELTRFREEELAHHDHAIEHGSRDAPAYELLSAIIKAGCRVAIKVSEKV